ncbi:hypothetical protein RRG08_009023 [Elysia crispata]|uniref:Uncharacterized protein n=1 Tax=Elysia crispata TaxID=231223 RepID=A0AAE1AIX6_9GAST|nr:hypothetical protein RRG08_009023 [Elysia crispata]
MRCGGSHPTQIQDHSLWLQLKCIVVLAKQHELDSGFHHNHKRFGLLFYKHKTGAPQAYTSQERQEPIFDKSATSLHLIRAPQAYTRQKRQKPIVDKSATSLHLIRAPQAYTRQKRQKPIVDKSATSLH